MNKYLWVLFLVISESSATQKNLRRQLSTPVPDPCDGSLLDQPCIASIAEFFDEGDIGATLFCETPDHNFLEVPCVTEEWINQQRSSGNLNSGVTELQFNGVTVDQNCMIVCSGPPTLVNPEIPPKDACEVGAVSGTRSVLVVRVEADNLVSPYSQAEFSDSLFGTAGDPVNLSSQTAACSHDFLNFEPSSFDTSMITDGTITVRVPSGTVVNSLTFQNAITRQLTEMFNVQSMPDIADHIMYCMPQGVMNSIAYGFINSWVSVHKPSWCRRVSTAFHELFHNVGLGHANDENFPLWSGSNTEYDDQTGYMGYSYSGDDHPQMCFNPANTYQLGWFCDKTVTCVPSPCNSCEIQLGNFVDYSSPNVENVLVRIEQPNGDFYYMTFNAKKGFNWQVVEGGDKVVINRQEKEGLFGDFTYLENMLDAGESHVIENFGGVAGQQVIIQVNSIVNDIASITISVPAPCNNELEPPPPSGSRGDPHFKTWKNEHYEFHGQCDLVLAKDDSFANGIGIDVHIRTKLVRYWSYIKSAAIRIGTDVLEVEGSTEADSKPTNYWINYEYLGELTTLGGFPVTLIERGLAKRTFEIDLDSVYPGQKIIIGHFKEFVSVEFEHASEASFGNSVGLLGNFTSGKTLARDGVTVLDDFSELGNAWQVLPSDPKLFRESSSPQFPNKCLEPEDPRGDRRRQLAESPLSESDAKQACAGLTDPMDRKDCVYDILATQDLTMVGAY